jgi:myosin-5
MSKKNSGAGKTVSAKYIMRYFATADDQEMSHKKNKSEGTMTEVEEQILGKGLWYKKK